MPLTSFHGTTAGYNNNRLQSAFDYKRKQKKKGEKHTFIKSDILKVANSRILTKARFEFLMMFMRGEKRKNPNKHLRPQAQILGAWVLCQNNPMIYAIVLIAWRKKPPCIVGKGSWCCPATYTFQIGRLLAACSTDPDLDPDLRTSPQFLVDEIWCVGLHPLDCEQGDNPVSATDRSRHDSHAPGGNIPLVAVDFGCGRLLCTGESGHRRFWKVKGSGHYW